MFRHYNKVRTYTTKALVLHTLSYLQCCCLERELLHFFELLMPKYDMIPKRLTDVYVGPGTMKATLDQPKNTLTMGVSPVKSEPKGGGDRVVCSLRKDHQDPCNQLLVTKIGAVTAPKYEYAKSRDRPCRSCDCKDQCHSPSKKQSTVCTHRNSFCGTGRSPAPAKVLHLCFPSSRSVKNQKNQKTRRMTMILRREWLSELKCRDLAESNDG